MSRITKLMGDVMGTEKCKLSDNTIRRMSNAVKLLGNIVTNAPYLDTPPPLPYRYCANLALNEARAFKLDTESLNENSTQGKLVQEYTAQALGAGEFASGPIVLVAINCATYRELPTIGGKPTLCSWRAAQQYLTLDDALAALELAQATYGKPDEKTGEPSWTFELMSFRCITGKLATYRGENGETALDND